MGPAVSYTAFAVLTSFERRRCFGTQRIGHGLMDAGEIGCRFTPMIEIGRIERWDKPDRRDIAEIKGGCKPKQRRKVINVDICLH